MIRTARNGIGAAAVCLLTGLAGCGAPASAGPQPAGKSPSEIARMVCAREAEGEIADLLGTKADITAPTWADHRYSCGYRYRAGTMVLSVKELSSWNQTYGYFNGLATTLHRTHPLLGLGQAAFTVRDGSVVVRKDWKVLTVNVAGLRGAVGSPPSSPAKVALGVAAVILACWAGD